MPSASEVMVQPQEHGDPDLFVVLVDLDVVKSVDDPGGSGPIRGLLMGRPVGNDAMIALVWCAIIGFLATTGPCGSTTATPCARSGC
jgi:hypothetical protein